MVVHGRKRSAEERARRRTAPPGVVPEEAPDASTNRLSLYLRTLTRCEAEGIPLVASDAIARAAGVKPALVRKDLAHFGHLGIRGRGYLVPSLRARITRILGLDRDHTVVILGAGNLGTALADSRGFNSGGFRTIALFDVDPRKVLSHTRGGLPILPLSELEDFVARNGVEIVVLAIPPDPAQAVLDRVSGTGVRAVLSFSPSVLRAKPGVHLRSVDLKIHLEALAHRLNAPALRKPRRVPPALAKPGAGA